MAVARLVVLVKVHVTGGRAHVAAGRRGHVEAVHRIQPHRRSILPEENFRVAGFGFAAPVVGCGRVQQADLTLALELRMLGMNLNRLIASLRG